jgi:hypothetical protein
MICRILSLIMLAGTAFLIWCAVTVTGGGFLDLSNIVRYVLTGMAVISGVIALILAKIGWKK